MSDIVEKTLGSLHNLWEATKNSSSKDSLPTFLLGKSRLESLINTISNATTKQEVGHIVKSTLVNLQKCMSQPQLKPSEMEDCLLQAMYCEMIGYPVPFAYIHAVKLAQQGHLKQKRIGYLAASCFLHKDHELVVLLINTIQKDLLSSNVMELCIGLAAVCSFVNAEMAPAVLPLVEERLSHSHAAVRKYAALALHHSLKQTKGLHPSHLIWKLEKMLTDRDPGVAGVAVTVLQDIVRTQPERYPHLIPSLIQIMKQIIERRLPADFEYSNIPAPWLQINILKMLCILGKHGSEYNLEMCSLLREVLRRAEICQVMNYAIIFECVRTIVSVTENADMIHLALSSVSKFIQSEESDLQYMGIRAMVDIMEKVKPGIAAKYQDKILGCLCHPDESLRLKTLDLLYAIANPANVQVICDKFLETLDDSSDAVLRQELVEKVIQLTEKYSSNGEWYMTTINSLLLKSDVEVPIAVVYKVADIVDKASSDSNVPALAATIYTAFCSRTDLPQSVIQLMTLVLSQLAVNHSSVIGPATVIGLLYQAVQQNTCTRETWLWILNNLLKVSVASGLISTNLQGILQLSEQSKCIFVRQKALEMTRIFDNFDRLKESSARILDKSTKIDPTLTFLDSYVCKALESGVNPYRPMSFRAQIPLTESTHSDSQKLSKSLNFQPYDRSLSSSSLGSDNAPSHHSLSTLGSLNSRNASMLVVKKKVWTREGRLKPEDQKQPSDVNSLTVKPNENGTTDPRMEDSDECKNSVSASISNKRELAELLFAGLSSETSEEQPKFMVS